MIPETKTDNECKKPSRIEASPEFTFSDQGVWGVLLKLRLAWGWLLLLATVVFAVILQMGAYQLIPWLGAAITAAGFGSSIWILKRNRKIVTPACLALSWNWAGCYLGMGILMFGIYAKTRYPLFIPPVIATGMGLSSWITASIYKKRLQSGLAFSWWCGALVMWVVGTDYTVLFLGGLLIGLELGPDWLLYRHLALWGRDNSQ